VNRKVFLPLLALALTISACSAQTNMAEPTPVPPTETTVPTLTATEPPLIPPLPSGLPLEALQNNQYTLEDCSGTIQTFQLADGSYASGADPAAVGYFAVFMGDVMAYGDLNRDGTEDAVVVLGVNCGGTGVFTYFGAVLNNNDGAPAHAASAFLDDRPMIGSLSIVDGEILADVTIHGAEDPMCCPTYQTRQGYRLFGDQLVQSRWVTWTQGTQERTIIIDTPAEAAEVTNPFTVNGEVTIAPFENTLLYRIYIPDGTLVNEFSLMVDSGGVMGGPGTFSQTFDLSNAGITGPVLIQFVDVSMMDGSTLALGSVVVNVQ